MPSNEQDESSVVITSSKNSNLQGAKKEKNDEFYTQIADVERELKNYRDHFQGKVVFCNCDDPEWSSFYKFFTANFEFLGLSKVISTHYEKGFPSYRLDFIGNGTEVKTELFGDGDFRSEECVDILKEADIVVTNPPFSLFREYVAQLIQHKKEFLIIGNSNAITYKEIFKLIKSNEIWLGFNSVKEFRQPDGTIKKFGNICWFTNLTHSKRNQELLGWKTFVGNESDYPKYDNFDAIEVSKVSDIPIDYPGLMGVPITFLDKFNPEQFEIVGNLGSYAPDGYSLSGAIFINGKKVFKRIAIKHRKVLQ